MQTEEDSGVAVDLICEHVIETLAAGLSLLEWVMRFEQWLLLLGIVVDAVNPALKLQSFHSCSVPWPCWPSTAIFQHELEYHRDRT